MTEAAVESEAPVVEDEPLPPMSTVQIMADREQKIYKLKVKIATLCLAITEAPQENVSVSHFMSFLMNLRSFHFGRCL